VDRERQDSMMPMAEKPKGSTGRSPAWIAYAALAAYFLLLMAALSLKPTKASLSDDIVSKDILFQAASWICTHSQGYWKTHPEAWPVDTLELGDQSYEEQEALEVLNTPPKGDATFILAHQLIAAKLNVASGANGSEIADTIAQADAWLVKNPLGSDPKGAEREEGTALEEQLVAYNEGDNGPGKCEEDEIPTATPTPQSLHTIIDAEKDAKASWKKKEGHSVSGEICVVNLGGADTENLTIIDQVQYRVDGEQDYRDIEGAQLIIQPEDPIPACDDPTRPESCPRECYKYQISFEPPGDAVAFRNTASITITNHTDWLPGSANCPGPDSCPFGPRVSADFELSEKSQDKKDKNSEPIEYLASEIAGSPVAQRTVTPTPSPSESPSPTRPTSLTPTPTELPAQE
jgi:hypothetical protein